MPLVNGLKIMVLVLGVFTCSFATNYMDQGNAFYKKGDFKRALLNYKSALEKGENKVMAEFNMANALYQLDQVGRALVLYKKIRRENPDFIRSYINEAGILFQMDEVGEALLLYKVAYALDDKNTSVIKMLGECYLKLGDRAQSLQYFEEGSRVEPQNLSWYYAMIDVYLGIEDFYSARDLLMNALKVNNEREELYFYLGEMELALGNKEAAILHFGAGLELDPKNTNQYMRLAGIHEEMKNGFLAVLVIREGIKKEAFKEKGFIEIARIYLEMGNVREALKSYVEAYEINKSEAVRDGFLRVLFKTGSEGNSHLFKETQELANAMWPQDPDVKELVEYFKDSI